MRVLSQTVNHRQRNLAIIIITLSILALLNFILLYPASPFALRPVGGMVLFCFLPGFALLPSLFPRRDSLDYLKAPISEDYTAFVHLVRTDGEREIGGQVDSQPSAGEEPTSSWTPGQVVVDDYVLSLPPDMPPGEYRLEIGMYDLKALKRLPAYSSEFPGEDDRIVISPTIVVR